MENKKSLASGQIAIIVKKSTPELCFFYEGTKDLENLISFVGQKPTIEFDKGKLIPKFKKNHVPENSYVLRNSIGDIRVLTEYDFTSNFDIQAVKEYSKEYANKILEKVEPKADKKK